MLRGGGRVSGLCSYIVSSLDGRVRTFICGCRDKLCSQTVVFRSVSETIQRLSTTELCLFCLRSQPFNIGSRYCPLRTDISQDSLSLNDISSTIEDEIPNSLKFNVGKLSQIVAIFPPCSPSQSGETLPIFTAERLCPVEMLVLYPIMLLTCCQIT